MKLSALFAASASAAITNQKLPYGRALVKTASYNTTIPALSQTAVTQYVDLNGTKAAYRRFGNTGAVPILYIPHFRASMDTTDPYLFNIIAQDREVILFDNFGVGHSEGEVPDSFESMAATTMDFLNAIDVSKIHVMGFSIGSLLAQVFTMTYPEVVEQLVLAASRPSFAPEAQEGNSTIFAVMGAPGQNTLEDFLDAFYYPSETSAAAGTAWWSRLQERQVEGEIKSLWMDGPGVAAQLTAAAAFNANESYYTRLLDLDTPILVTNGKRDVMLPTFNTYLVQQQAKNALAHIYPDSGHAHLFQFPEAYAASLALFLKS